MRPIYLLFLLGLGIAVIGINCGRKSTEPEPTKTESSVNFDSNYSAIEWVSLAVAYDTTVDKREYSYLLFGAEWCGWCKKFKALTLADSSVIQILGESFNCIELDIDSDSLVLYRGTPMKCRDVARNIFGITGVPAMKFLTHNGDVMGGLAGYQSIDEFKAVLDDIVK